VQFGATGDIGSPGCKDHLTFHSHIVPPGLLNPTGDNVIAVRVYSQGRDYPAGLYDSGAPDRRDGAYDAGASPGQRQTGHTEHFQLTSEQSNEGEVSLRFDGV
jgi:hypothetical protein